MADYSNDSIYSLKGAETIRQKPASILGTDSNGHHCFIEIIANSADEWRAVKFLKPIEVIKHSDGSITVKDYGRGCPLDWNEREQKMNYELVFMTLYAGGKYKTNEEESYEFSTGTNGLGATATQFTSKFMNVEVVRDGYIYQLHFEKGELIGEMIKKKTNQTETYTLIHWIPDSEVFLTDEISSDFIKDILNRQAIVNSGMKFSFVDENINQKYDYYYENGIIDYIKTIANNKSFTDVMNLQKETRGKERADKNDYKVKMQIAFTFCNENNLIEHYHNGSWLDEGGSPDKAIKSGFVSVIDRYLISKNKYLKNEKKITFDDVKDSLIVVTNNFSTYTSYVGQTKNAINNVFIKDAMTDLIKEYFEVFISENPTEAEKICNQILVNKRARERSEKTRIDVRKKLEGTISITNKVDGFVDCKNKIDGELFIAEGQSALGSLIMSRDAEFQACMPIRGKILNCLKAEYDKIFGSEIIVNLLKVMGCGIEVKSKHNKDLNSFDKSKLRWSKIIIATDSDVDGFQIRTLILTLIYRLTPTLLREGYVYIAESPLFEVVQGDKVYYAYDEDQLDKIVKGLKGKYKVNRNKGLGEVSAEVMSETMMHPQTRNLTQVTVKDVEKMIETFELFLGDKVAPRKAYLEEHFDKYIEMADV